MQNCVWDGLTNKYSLSKTLRFELKPIGKTLEFIKEKGLVEEDKERDKNFKNAKKIIDEYYKSLIEDLLKNVKINYGDLNGIYQEYEKIKASKNKEEKNKIIESYEDKLENLHETLYNQLIEKDFEKNNFGKELIRKNLIDWLDSQKRYDEKKEIEKFKNWTTYFKNFFDARKNIFSKDEKPTSIFYRIVYDNLPKYLENIKKLEELKKYGIQFEKLEKDFYNTLNGKKIYDYFNLENFNLFLNQSGIDTYNKIVGGFINEEGEKIKGINEYINEFSQKYHNESLSKPELDNIKKSIKSHKLLFLYKQILTDRELPSYLTMDLNNSDEVLYKIKQFKENNLDKYLISVNETKNDLFLNLKNLLSRIKEYDLKKIYVTQNKINSISNELFGDWSLLMSTLREINLTADKNSLNKDVENLENEFENKIFSLYEIEEAINLIEKNKKEFFYTSIIDYFSNFKFNKKDLFIEIEEAYRVFKEINLANQDLRNDSMSEEVEKIKNYLDSIMNLLHFIDSLNINPKKISIDYEIDTDFYNAFYPIYDSLSGIIPLYNSVRNYITQKPFKTGKFKLNFNNYNLADGWDKNKEKDNWSVIFRKKNERNKYDYYLGIMTKEHKKIFDILMTSDNETDFFEKMEYKLLPEPNKMLPKVFFSKKQEKVFNPSDEIKRIRNHATYTRNGKPQKGYNKEEFNIDDCRKLIDFFKECLAKHNDWKVYNFTFKPTEQYNNINEFYEDIEKKAYKLSFVKYSEKDIMDYVENGKFFLFKIYNKDFSEYYNNKNKKNLHTLYFESLFSDENLKKYFHKLSGKAELFYREGSIANPIIHPKKQEIQNKDPINGKKSSLFNYDIIKDKRYTEDKFFFYCPIELNYKCTNRRKINFSVNSIISNSENLNIIGIDRGEKNLIYYSLIDINGKIIKQGSFNIIKDDKGRQINYLEKLDNLEKERQASRKKWQKIMKIKEMKEGYLSFVVHELSKMVIENNAILVLENLNSGFKKERLKIEKQIYQKFEKKLIEKLNYLVFKDKTIYEPGGLLNAYQLTEEFKTFKKLGAQSGILFYVNARNTSKIDPTTGFINKLWPNYINIGKSKEYFSKFDSINYDNQENYFVFRFKYKNFFKNINGIFYEKEWEVCTYGTRWSQKLIKNTNNYEFFEIDLTEALKRLFGEYSINYLDGSDLKNHILTQNDSKFFESLMYYLKLTLQLRNRNEKEDFILSCVKNKNNEFFDSRKSKGDTPVDADANGSYNVAVKGMILVDKIKKGTKELSLKEDEYLDYLLNKVK